ncbi:hypothetical protein LINPERPRIM_LOCUS25299 [Linum perenne]
MSLRQTMVEHRQLMEASMAGNARQEFRKILTTPLVQSRALPPDGLGSMSNGVGNVHVESGEVDEEVTEDQSVAHLVEEFNHLDMDDEPWSVKMVRLGCRVDLATEAKRQYKSSQRLLKELYEAGHKHVGLLGEDGGRYPFYVL